MTTIEALKMKVDVYNLDRQMPFGGLPEQHAINVELGSLFPDDEDEVAYVAQKIDSIGIAHIGGGAFATFRIERHKP